MEPDSELRAMLSRYTGPEPGHPWEQTKRDINRLAQRLQSVLEGFKTAADDAGEIEHVFERQISEGDQDAQALLDLLLSSGWYDSQTVAQRRLFDKLAASSHW